ncbi:receptor-type tyrosine-protein phosphatase epsilon [Patella vulgata]|uniref:receptor-type tyrosine-protein phosphatase epsilon n=1 Tax=Patella vulgata TaxID=6465 RepID=UPI0024A9E820|nr:receptor-type tyrosine-protein phosphatase epsilon [Patella vulgata]XP_055956572.1 receptor-type tyrosine-protein phosphatase epsilon [Patella vulgata]
MIWEQKSDKVIMLTNTREMGKLKCEQYWPEEGCERFGGITLTLQEETVRADFTIRHIFMIKDGVKHEFHHFHYTSWPDHDVPNASDLLDFLYMVNKHKPNSNIPQIVHCSAGVGRTGTYIAIDCGLKQGKETGSFDVIEFIKTIRNQRRGMIQTAGQLQFVYEALTEGFKYGDTSLDKTVLESQLDANNSSTIIGQMPLHEQCEYLRQITVNTDTHGIDKDQDSSAYIYPSRTNKIGYIMADMNGYNTESIWQLIQNHNCSVTVAFLNSSNEVAICPERDTEEKYGSVELENKSDTRVSNNLNLITVSASQYENTERKIVKVLLMNVDEHRSWLVLANQIKELVEQIDIHHNNDNNPIAVFSNELCVGQLFCVIRNIIQRIKLDNEVEIFENVRKMHQQISCVINSQDEYLSLHRFAAEYVKSSSLYANL